MFKYWNHALSAASLAKHGITLKLQYYSNNSIVVLHA